MSVCVCVSERSHDQTIVQAQNWSHLFVICVFVCQSIIAKVFGGGGKEMCFFGRAKGLCIGGDAGGT